MIKVLIVDDEETMRLLLSGMLKKLDCEINEAENGVIAQQKAIHWQPDLILLDFLMPNQDGCSTCRNLRRKGYKGRIIMMSALNASGNDTGVCGADNFLQKPISLEKLRECLSALAIDVHSA